MGLKHPNNAADVPLPGGKEEMTEQTRKDSDQQPDSYAQFAIALALATMISAVAFFFFEYFGIIDVIKCWP